MQTEYKFPDSLLKVSLTNGENNRQYRNLEKNKSFGVLPFFFVDTNALRSTHFQLSSLSLVAAVAVPVFS